MKISNLPLIVGLALGLSQQINAAPVADGTFSFIDGAPAVQADTFTLQSGVYVNNTLIPLSPANNTAFTRTITSIDPLLTEMRIIGTNGNVATGGEKTIVGRETDLSWGVQNGNIASSNGEITPGPAGLGVTQGLFLGANIKGGPLSFAFDPLNPISTNIDFSTNTLTLTTDRLEMQWGGTFFPLGESGNGLNECNTDGQGCGVTFTGSIFNLADNGSFDFNLFAEHRITPYEDTAGGTGFNSGFSGWVLQFGLQGSYTPVPVPAAIWLFGSGALMLLGSSYRRKKHSTGAA